MSVLAGRRRFILLLFFTLALFYPTFRYWYEIQNTLTSASRPLWAVPTGPQRILPHYYASGLWATEEICELHGWRPRPVVEIIERDMWDALILDGPTDADLDLLEIRLHELYEVVDRVFIVESNRTINGSPRPFVFGDHRFDERFSFSRYKFVYKAVPAPPLDSLRSPSPDAWATHLRGAMNELLRARSSNTLRTPLVLFSAVDEIPAGYALRLLRDCVFPSPLHLQLRRYMYGFAWPVGWGSWRAQVHVWDEALGLGAAEGEVQKVRTEYSHEMVSETALADAGWHCSHCYRNLDDLISKMQDEFGSDAAFLSRDRIQKAICEGKDLFNVLPEAYSYKDMLQLLNPEPSKSAVGIPKYVIEEAARFKYLLPGGCMREEHDN